MGMPNLFDANTRRAMGDLYGDPSKTLPTREAYRAQLHRWSELAEKKCTRAEMAAIEADQAKRVKGMKGNA